MEKANPPESGMNLEAIKGLLQGVGAATSKKHPSNYTLEERKAWKKRNKKVKKARKATSKSRKINRGKK